MLLAASQYEEATCADTGWPLVEYEGQLNMHNKKIPRVAAATAKPAARSLRDMGEFLLCSAGCRGVRWRHPGQPALTYMSRREGCEVILHRAPCVVVVCLDGSERVLPNYIRG